jgi:hypothetical protein
VRARQLLPPLLLLLSGCGGGTLVGAQREALSHRYGAESVAVGYAPSDRCQTLSDRHTNAGALGELFGFLASGSGVVILPAEELPENWQGPVQYTATGAVVTAGALAAYYAVVAHDSAVEFERECLK